MFKRSLLSVLFATCLACALSACGAGQSGRGTAPWTTSADAIPENAAWALWFDLSSSPDEVQSLVSQSTAGPQAIVMNSLFDVFGLDPTDPDSLTSYGVDFAGDVALFSTGLLPAVVLRLADADAFLQTLDRLVVRNPDYMRSDVQVGSHSVSRFQDTTTELAFDVAVVRSWAVLRVVPNGSSTGLSDEAFASVLRGRNDHPFLAGTTGSELLARVPDAATPKAVFYLPSSTIAEIVQSLLTSDRGLGRLVAGLGIRLLAPEYETDELRDRCWTAQERVTTTLPWIASISWSHAATPNVTEAELLLRMSPAGLERFGATFQSTPPLDALYGHAPAFGAVALDLGPFLRAVLGDPSLRECPDLGSIPGWITFYRDTRVRTVEILRRRFDGRGGFALFGFQMAGFLPMPDAAIMTSSSDPMTLLTQLQRLLERSGASGRVDDTAPDMTFRYRMLAYRFLLTLRENMVAFSVGDVDRAQLSLLTSPETTDRFLEVQLEPARIAELLAPLVTMAIENETLPAEMAPIVEEILERMRGTLRWELHGRIADRALVLQQRMEDRAGER